MMMTTPIDFSFPYKIDGDENNVFSSYGVYASMMLRSTSKFGSGEGNFVVSLIFDRNKVEFVVLVQRTTDSNNKDDVIIDGNVICVPTPEMLSSMTKIRRDVIMWFH
ncbi:hypothetical protein H5410_045878 [Solanum commersonii]|uniref:Uncharacterized protein n=1 Tax=Solanum commersonii TaxID=4109 RepID=A0A9J5XE05_SOLCO|nr:hypothetical protein H5410_045878 [Solanum commersonii]